MFTPAESSIGALFIQYATGSYMAVEGKVVGFSNIIFNSVFKPTIHNISIVLGVLFSGRFIKRFLPDFVPLYASSTTNNPSILGSLSNYSLSGALVGLGTSLAHGCTSGHMIAGVSRLRLRSIVATAVFASTAAITSALLHNGTSLGLGVTPFTYDDQFVAFNANKDILLKLLALGFAHSYIVMPYVMKRVKASGDETWIKVAKFFSGLSTGFQFGLGLLISGMASSTKVLGFLSIFNKEKFDPSLLLIPALVVLPNIFIWRKQLPQTKLEGIQKSPILENSYDLSFSDTIDTPFILGNVVFGVGWGLSGICPATGLLGAEFNGKNGAFWLASFIGGYFAGNQLEYHQVWPCSSSGSTATI
ncbi:hypothetical protein FOA43_003572 [Brettanomyces nanus]|uniref:Sulphur transport domain-containing protein n=1 Tax=Eeniella nana TaxID=13502 RepID=A0A875S4F2_EENNA|nr:uncharacterized protein FOA43_003572 [Brettanomyces nanus]QPG76186.1 hypothetical protein FOA43_003572 [Brettanomyces nanus]